MSTELAARHGGFISFMGDDGSDCETGRDRNADTPADLEIRIFNIGGHEARVARAP